MAFPDSTFPCGGYGTWGVHSYSPEVVTVNWDIQSFLRECQEERKELRSYEFGFADATWNLFISFDRKKVNSVFGVNVKPRRFSNAVFDCHCEIKFFYNDIFILKDIECKFNCENADSHSAATDFFSNSELDKFLQSGSRIRCTITIKKSNVKEASPLVEIADSSSSNAVDAHTLNHMLPNHSMAFPDSTWPCSCDHWIVASDKPEEVFVDWCFASFLRECYQGERKELKSNDFGFAGATWNLFTSLDQRTGHILFGISVEPYRFSQAVFDCKCDIKFYAELRGEMKTIGFRFKCGSSDSYYAVENFLSDSELDEFLEEGDGIDCSITVTKSGVKEACPAEITHSSNSSAVDGKN